MCVLRALAVDETAKERGEHVLDLSLLDHFTWPSFAWEFLRLTEDPLAEKEWEHRLLAKPPQPHPTAAAKKGSKGKAPAAAAAPAAAGTAQARPRRRAYEPLSKAARAAMDAILNPEAGAAAGQDVAEQSTVPAAAEGAPAAAQSSGEAAAPGAAAGSDSQPPAATAVEEFAVAAPPVPPLSPEYYSLPVELKAALLSRLCDHLLDCVTIRFEIERREKAMQFVAGKGGVGGGWAIMSEAERKVAEDKVGGWVAG